jgi:hypothetical protein
MGSQMRSSVMPHTFSMPSKLRKLWGRTLVLQPTSTSACLRSDLADSKAQRASPGGPSHGRKPSRPRCWRPCGAGNLALGSPLGTAFSRLWPPRRRPRPRLAAPHERVFITIRGPQAHPDRVEKPAEVEEGSATHAKTIAGFAAAVAHV